MKNTLKSIALTAMIASTSAFAWEATDYNNYMDSLNSQIDNFNPTAFGDYKADADFEALEAKLVTTVAQMKGFWYVAQASKEQKTQPISFKITDAKSYLDALNASADGVNADVFKNFLEDPEFKRLESQLVATMNEMANFKK